MDEPSIGQYARDNRDNRDGQPGLFERLRLGTLSFGVAFLVIGVLGVSGTDLSGAWAVVAILAAIGTAGLATGVRSLLR